MSFPNKLNWYYRRLASMSLPEISYRLKQQLKTRQDRHYYQPQSQNTVFFANSATHWPPFFFNPQNHQKIVAGYKTLFPVEYRVTLQTADQLLVHKITLFENQFDLGTEINWHRDPKTGKVWPDKFYADIDTRDGKTVGGVKWVWELNRHHHLVTLAKSYFLSGEEKYAQEVCTQLKSWLQANQPGYGVNWTSSLELALRIINWGWILAFIRQSTMLTPSLLTQILQSIAEQARYISRHLSAFSSANNHLIGEAAGLAFAGLAFPHLSESAIWRDTGLAIIEREIELQIHSDGVPAEQATDYLAFILDFNLQVWRLAELNGVSVRNIWFDRLEAAAEFIAYIMDSGGNAPSIGDSDDAWVVRLDDRPDVNNFRSILASAAVIFNRPDFKTVAMRWDEKSFWLLGEAGFQTFTNLADEAPKLSSRTFERGGYTILSAPNRRIIFDHAPLGYLSTAAHGHADALSLWVSIEGIPVLIDSNTYAYQEGYEWRDYFRSTAAHNTVVVDGQDQSEMQGTFLWGQKATTQLLYKGFAPHYDLVVAQHNGYAGQDIIHRRVVFFYKPDWLVVTDGLLGSGEHTIEQLWHFPPKAKLMIETTSVQVNLDNKVILVFPDNDLSGNVIQHKGSKSPVQGWVSPHYSQLLPAPVLSFYNTVNLPYSLQIIFYLGSEQQISTLQTQKNKVLQTLHQLLQEVSL